MLPCVLMGVLQSQILLIHDEVKMAAFAEMKAIMEKEKKDKPDA